MRFAGLLAALFIATVAARAHADEVTLELRGAGRCPSRAELVTALRAQGVGSGDDGELLEIRRREQSLTAELHAGVNVYRRVIRTRDCRCPDIAEAVAFLVRTWTSGLPQVPATERVSERTEVPPVRGRETEPVESAVAPVAASQVATAVAPPPTAEAAPPLPATLVETIPVRSDAPEVAPPAVVSVEVVEPSSARRLSLLAAGGGAIGETGLGGYEVSGTLDGAFGRWHAELRGSYLNPFTLSLGSGAVEVNRGGASAFATFELVQADAIRLELLAGPSVQVWGAQGQNFTVPKSPTVWVPGGTLGTRVRYCPSGPVFVFAAAEATLLAAPAFEADVYQTPTSVTPQRLWISAEAGLGLWVF